MVEGRSHMLIAGPPVAARVGEAVTEDELGAAEIHARAGAVDDVVASEAEAFARGASSPICVVGLRAAAAHGRDAGATGICCACRSCASSTAQTTWSLRPTLTDFEEQPPPRWRRPPLVQDHRRKTPATAEITPATAPTTIPMS
jgi:hypothetical protein